MDKRLPSEITSYDLARDWLFNRIDYERIRPNIQTKPFQLERLRQLLELIGSPQERIPVVHIAGTKGKGSTAALLESILRHSGLRTGLFTSPHIHCFEERMRVNGAMPSQQRITQLIAGLAGRLEQSDGCMDRQPTFFEATTLLGWMLFDQQQTELVVLETGLGGRLDCTNVCRPLVTIITSIGLDHTHILGNTLELIAAEKAGILKPGAPILEGRLPPTASAVVGARAVALGVPHLKSERDFHAVTDPDTALSKSFPEGSRFAYSDPQTQISDLKIPLPGSHQLRNAELAIKAALLLKSHFPGITEASIRTGLWNTCWPLRFEVFTGNPTIILDAAHNEDSVNALVGTLARFHPPEFHASPGPPRVLIFASSSDKDVRAMLKLIIPHFDHIILTRYVSNPRSISAEQLLTYCAQLQLTQTGNVTFADNPTLALQAAREKTGPTGTICVTGSLFLAAEVRAMISDSTSLFETF